MNTILFDLDGTLLPITQDNLLNTYYRLLGEKVAALDHDAPAVMNALLAGTAAMRKNDGTMRNRQRFWETFALTLGYEIPELETDLASFYQNEFHQVKQVAGPDPGAAELVRTLKHKGYTVALATNPVFPLVALLTRMSWLGLTEADFDLITSYENSGFCKPNPLYYQEILDKLGKRPEECLMVGNNRVYDLAAMELGIPCFLVTDYPEKSIPGETIPCPNGSFEDLKSFLLGENAR